MINIKNRYSIFVSSISNFLNDKIKYFNNKINEEYVKIYLLYFYIFMIISIFFIYFLPVSVAFFFILLSTSFIFFSTYENSQIHYEAVSVLLNKEYDDRIVEINYETGKEYSLTPGCYYIRTLEKANIFVDIEEEREIVDTIKSDSKKDVEMNKRIKMLELELELEKLKNS